MSVFFWFYKDELLYIGSSMNIKQRLEKYKSDDRLGNQTSFIKQLIEKGISFNELDFEEVKTGINDRKELEILEGNCQLLYKPIFNKTIAGGVNLDKTDKRSAEQRRESKKNGAI